MEPQIPGKFFKTDTQSFTEAGMEPSDWLTCMHVCVGGCITGGEEGGVMVSAGAGLLEVNSPIAENRSGRGQIAGNRVDFTVNGQ